MVQRVIVEDGNSSLGLALLVAPPLIPPGYLVYKTWVALSNDGLHPVFRLVVAGLEVCSLFYGLMLFYRHFPPFLTVVAAIAYMAATYGWAIRSLGADQIWTGAMAFVAGVFGYFVGQHFVKVSLLESASNGA